MVHHLPGLANTADHGLLFLLPMLYLSILVCLLSFGLEAGVFFNESLVFSFEGGDDLFGAVQEFLAAAFSVLVLCFQFIAVDLKLLLVLP